MDDRLESHSDNCAIRIFNGVCEGEGKENPAR